MSVPSLHRTLARCAAVSLAVAVVWSARAHAWRAPPAVAALFHGGDAPVTVGPAPSPLRGVDVDDCATCHAAIAAEWRASLHADSWRDPVFLRSYAHEPTAFCRNCHAPTMAPGAAEPDDHAQREGTSCAVCHVRDGHVLGTGAGRGDAAPRRDPHAMTVRAELATSAFCGGCHQFDFPVREGGTGHSGEPMQDTLGEWTRSAPEARAHTCQDCHMPWRTTPTGQRYRSHSFVGLRDPALLRAAVRVDVSVRRDRAATTVRVRLTPDQIAHAFPTGDLFRQAELAVWLDGDPASQRTELLTRRYGTTASHRRTTVGDTRLAPPGAGAAREVTLTLPPSCAAVRWRLDHLRMPVEHALRERFTDAQNRTRVVDGVVPAQGSCSGDTRTVSSN